jgi:hypothetical protein
VQVLHICAGVGALFLRGRRRYVSDAGLFSSARCMLAAAAWARVTIENSLPGSLLINCV